MNNKKNQSRRKLIGTSLLASSALTLSGFTFKPENSVMNNDESLFMIGPREGYTPLIGTLVSMFENMTEQVKKQSKTSLWKNLIINLTKILTPLEL